MATILPTSQTQYLLSEQEELEGMLLTTNQKFRIQNLIASHSDQIMGMLYDPEHQLAYLQADACFKGKRELLIQLLEDSKNAEEALIQAAKYNQ